MRYNWQKDDWTNFRYEESAFEADLLSFVERAGRTAGLLEGATEDLGAEAILDLMISEAMKSSAIEGEFLSQQDVKSSIRNHLGLNQPSESVKDQRASGIGELMVSVRETYQDDLTATQLFEWHRMLMKGSDVEAGLWRTGEDAMQVVSGRIDRPTVHFEAPPSSQVSQEMEVFTTWFNSSRTHGKSSLSYAPIRSGLAHLYFESIHPFEDGNGRMGRALSEKALSQGLGRPVLLSLSQTIEADRKSYYQALEDAQRGNEVTDWLCYFVRTVLEAQKEAEARIQLAVRKKNYFVRHQASLNERQLKVVRRLFDAEPDGFEGGLSAKKYMAISGTSKATATRDLQLLHETGALRLTGAGRSTRYWLPE